jgi:hypothetical protein
LRRRRLKEVDPISLDRLDRLRCPPFAFATPAATLAPGAAVHWFDGRVLASYLVSTGRFQHPITRAEIDAAGPPGAYAHPPCS